MKKFVPVLALAALVFGACATSDIHSRNHTLSHALGGEGQDVIRLGMSFREALALLEKHHAKPTTIQIEYPDEKKNRRIEHFVLADERTIEFSLTRKQEGADWTIKAIFEVIWPHPEQSREKEWRGLHELGFREPILLPEPTPGRGSS